MKFPEKVGNGPMNKRLNFGGDPDHGSGYGNRNTSNTCLGGGMLCPIASSYIPFYSLASSLLLNRPKRLID